MKLNVQSLLAFLYPPSEDERALENYSKEQFVKKLDPTFENFVWSLASFKDQEIRAAIHLNKFHNHQKAQRLLGSLLSAWLKGLPIQNYTMIPIPLPKKRERIRGHNQVSSIANIALDGLPQFSLDEHVLMRVRETPPQTTLSPKGRRDNLAGAFTVGSPNRIQGEHIILIDDVCTTGTTLDEARKTVKLHNPASVLCVAIAH